MSGTAIAIISWLYFWGLMISIGALAQIKRRADADRYDWIGVILWPVFFPVLFLLPRKRSS
jgi:hypothetical protein